MPFKLHDNEISFDEAKLTIMPFGKHVGKTLSEVPLTYLDWLLGAGIRNPLLLEAVRKYLSDPGIAGLLEDEMAQ